MAKVKTKDLAEALLHLTEGKSAEETKKILTEFVQYLAKKSFLGKGDKIMEEYRALYNKKHEILEATVILLNRMPDKDLKELSESLKKKFGAKQVHINQQVDQRVLGGMKVKIGDTIYDSTLKNTLAQLKTSLLK